ncbi:MAG: hypothetical protein CVU56_09920 [Deltaproteobacteria bacterium HGW-Deltaproteobacteria-14]|nr:MAG: hypothetical protein CVU56_09920 [Deltaproteobacteria bacterium HGW-Deltaproteobacteria-14]
MLSYERGRLRQALPKVVGRCMSYSAMTCFDESLVASVYRFYGLEVDVATAETEILEDESERVRFFPWFLWDWRVDDGATIGERFLRESELSPWEARMVEGLCHSYVGFYEVVSHDATTVHLVDMATGEALEIQDDALAADLGDTQILQARLVKTGEPDEGLALVDAVYAALPGEARTAVKLELESLLGDAHRPEHLLKAYAPEMLDFADHLIDSLGQPPIAENADGEELVLVRTVLRPTDGLIVAAALAREVEGVAEIETRLWMVRTQDRSLGFIDGRDPQRVAIGANTLSRHEALVGWLTELTGVAATPLKTVEDFGRAVQRWAERGGGDPWLIADPEVRAAVGDWFAAWTRQWLDMPHAALGERTPREAVREPGGRAQVEGMVARFEDLLLGELGAVQELRLESLRAELGLLRKG